MTFKEMVWLAMRSFSASYMVMKGVAPTLRDAEEAFDSQQHSRLVRWFAP